MAITTNASYVPTCNEFVAHWEQVNAAKPPATPLILNDGTTTGMNRAELIGLRDALIGIEEDMIEFENGAEIARSAEDGWKRGMLKWFGRFMDVFEGYYGSSDLAGARPLAPSPTSALEVFLKPMIDMADLWLRINALPAPPGVTLPLILVGDTALDTLDQDGFTGFIANSRMEADNETKAQGKSRQEMSRRNFKQKEIYAALLLYRKAMPGSLPALDPLQNTLPRLTPEKGHTPDPVNASAVYVSGSTSKTVYEASPDDDLKEYQLRGCIGTEWNEDAAVSLGTNQPEDAREFVVPFGLTQPETSIALKVYVVLNSGNERGSAAMTVTRPAAP